MTTKNEYIASIMLEAADLLQMDESAGANGARRRFYEERAKQDQKKVDELQRKVDRYKRAGYEDKAPIKELEDAKKQLAKNKNTAHALDTRRTDTDRWHRRDLSLISKVPSYYRDHNRSFDDYFNRNYKESDYEKAYYKPSVNRRDLHTSVVNDRINKRAAMKEAIDLLYDKAMECDTLDEATEYINKAEQLESLIDE